MKTCISYYLFLVIGLLTIAHVEATPILMKPQATPTVTPSPTNPQPQRKVKRLQKKLDKLSKRQRDGGKIILIVLGIIALLLGIVMLATTPASGLFIGLEKLIFGVPIALSGLVLLLVGVTRNSKEDE